MRLFLVRHAQTAWNLQRRAQGHRDEPLDELGHEQARALAASGRILGIERVWSSDLCRCTQTARPLAASLGLQVLTDPRLRERSFGEWEGRNYSEVKSDLIRLAPQGNELAMRPPGGESTLDVWERLDPVLADLSVLTESTALFSHGGTTSLLMAKLLGAPPEASRSFRFPNCGVAEFRRRPDGVWSLIDYRGEAPAPEPNHASAGIR